MKVFIFHKYHVRWAIYENENDIAKNVPYIKTEKNGQLLGELKKDYR